MPEGREGPHISYSCHGCRYHEQERFQAQGDSGYDHYCTHSGESKLANTYSAAAPTWCPFIPANQ